MIFNKAIDNQTNGGKQNITPTKKKKPNKKIIINIKRKVISTRRNHGLKENALDKSNTWCNQNDSSIDTSDNNIINNSLYDGSNSIHSNYLNFKNSNSMNQNEFAQDLSASAVITNFPVLSELKIKTINFEIKYDTNIGETLGIIGSLNELGLWKQSKALKMVWNKGNIWTTTLNLNNYNNAINFEYKFIILSNGKIKYWEDGYDDIYAQRQSSSESWLKKVTSKAYYRILQHLTYIPIQKDTGDFRLMDRKCIEALRQMRETDRNTKGMYSWIGFRKKGVFYHQKNRKYGNTKWSLYQLINLALTGITSFTTAPLRLASVFGFVISICAFVYLIYIIVKTIIVGEPVQGFPTLMVTILFLGGIQLISLGIIGEYLGHIFNETKKRPNYFIRSKSK